MQNADCILIMGSKMAENHPVGFQWVMEARLRGTPVIHVDPRFTRTSANAAMHVPIRAGSDLAFLGGLVNYILEHDRWFHEYVLAYTNASTIVSEDFRDTEDLDGLFSGWDAEREAYDEKSWGYNGVEGAGPAERTGTVSRSESAGALGGRTRHAGCMKHVALQHPRSVFQLLKRHFQRYTPAMLERVTGVPAERFVEVAELLCNNSGRDRTSAIVYSVGWTQHSVGVQLIRTAAIVQMLLGNIGRPGGGILALRGHASIQGSTDIPTLYDLLPGYMPMPHADDVTLERYLADHAASGGGWGNLPAYLVSMLKAFYGGAATAENGFGFD